MTSSFDPTPRPALRKAVDSEIHPTTYSASPNSTNDAVLGGKDVEITVRIPKKLRKELRRIAKLDSVSVDQIVTNAVATEVQRRSS